MFPMITYGGVTYAAGMLCVKRAGRDVGSRHSSVTRADFRVTVRRLGESGSQHK